jgi:acyl-CoA thioesterase II
MPSAMQELLAILDLERLEHNLYRGRSPQVNWQRFSADRRSPRRWWQRSAPSSPTATVHSLHGYFMRPGDTNVPIIYQVDRIRDGGSFTTRRVAAIQHGQAIFSLEASFQLEEEGLTHQMPMPLNVPPPEDVEDAE